MVIDAHVHLHPARLAEAIRRYFHEHIWHVDYALDVEECIATLRRGGIDRMVALPYAHKPGIASALNDFTLELSRRHPEVIPCCTVYPGERGIIDQALAGPFRGVKIHSHVMRVSPDDPRLDEVWAASARHRKPVVIHCGPEPASAGYGIDVRQFSGADKLARALRRFPDAIAIVPHLGVDQSAQFEAMLAEFPNLYLDTAMVIGDYFPVRPDLDILRRHPDRILYGTDFPNLPYAWDKELAVVRGMKLPHEEKILGLNALKLFQ